MTMSRGTTAHRAPHIVFLQTLGQGHINPTVPLVHALTQRGCVVTYFADAEGPPGKDYVSPSTPLGQAVLAAGATLRSYRMDPSLCDEPRLSGFLNARWHRIPGLLEDLRALRPKPRMILYDPFNPTFPAVARIISCPHMALIPHSGPGTMASVETEENKEKARGVRDWLLEHHGLDLFELGLPAASWYSRTLNLVLTSDRFFAPLATDAQRGLWHPSAFHCVGTMQDPRKSFRPAQKDFPLDQICAARDGGKRVVLVSLGSVVTGTFFEAPLGRVVPSHISNNDDGAKVMDGFGRIQTLRDMTGGDFMRFVFRCVFQALGSPVTGSDGGDESDFLVLLVCGDRGPEVLKDVRDPESITEEAYGLPIPLPSNFLAFHRVPQLELLPLCSCFITHGGMGSVMESLLFRVPMAVVPCFGDQVWNADCMAETDMGVSFRYPLRTLSVDSLRDAVMEISAPGAENSYRRAVEAAATQMEQQGGAEGAASIVLKAIETEVRGQSQSQPQPQPEGAMGGCEEAEAGSRLQV